MTGDLISREALKNDITQQVFKYKSGIDVFTAKRIVKLVDNAPTVEERQQGEWIENVERRGFYAGDKTVYSYTCPFCKVTEFKKYPFCHCGADMRGGLKNDRE